MPSGFEPKPISRGDPIPAAWLRQITDHVLSRISFTGGLTRRVGNQLVLSKRQFGGDAATPFIMIRISANTPLTANDTNGNPTQWRYTGVETSLSGIGYGGWADVFNGWTGNAYNMAENLNTGDFALGNGVDHGGADYPATFDMSPITTGMIVPALLLTVSSGAPPVPQTDAWFFPIPNGEDGTCTA